VTFRNRKAVASVQVLMCGLIVTACNSAVSGAPLPTTDSSVPLPPSSTATRPKNIDLTTHNPCDSIPKSDYSKFQITEPGYVGHDKPPMPDSRICSWSTDSANIDVIYVAGEGIEAWTTGARQSQAVPIAPIDGFPAYNLQPASVPGSCDLVTDSNQGQYVFVGVRLDDAAADPCPASHEVAESILTNLTGS
jgi:uncharacterized protein DUF3558